MRARKPLKQIHLSGWSEQVLLLPFSCCTVRKALPRVRTTRNDRGKNACGLRDIGVLLFARWQVLEHAMLHSEPRGLV